MVKKFFKPAVVILSLMALFSCSTKKDGLLGVNKGFHNINAHYNGFYNAKLKLAEGAQKLAESDKDNYDKILHVYRYGDITKAKAIFPQMDDAIKRCSEVISKHSMMIKGNEHCKWIPDNWLVIGKAQFYKHDYYPATETFQYIATNYSKYPNSNSKDEALLWLAKSYLELTKLQDAENTFDFLRNERKFPARIRADFEASQADFYLQTKNYPKTIEHLEKAVIFTKHRDERSRWCYILAQLQQKEMGDMAKAYDLYTKVIKLNPP